MEPKTTNLGNVGLIGRFKPLHNGAYVLLESACQNADKVTIGIGSSNKYNVRNPFAAAESEEMINLALAKFPNYKIIHIPDFAHHKKYRNGGKWKQYVLEKFGDLNYFITGNEYVKELLKGDYKIIHPTDIIQEEKWTKLRAAEVRHAIAAYQDWEKLVPGTTVDYLEKTGLIKRFREEFGLETISMLAKDYNLNENENKQEEKLHTQEI